jgi:hypothetical protein
MNIRNIENKNYPLCQMHAVIFDAYMRQEGKRIKQDIYIKGN